MKNENQDTQKPGDKVDKAAVASPEVEAENEYFFPTHGKAVRAKSREEAQAKLEELIKIKTNI